MTLVYVSEITAICMEIDRRQAWIWFAISLSVQANETLLLKLSNFVTIDILVPLCGLRKVPIVRSDESPCVVQ